MKLNLPAFCLLVFRFVQLCHGYYSQPSVISPGIGLEGRDGTEVVIFEHTSFGTGGLVLNRPTPVLLKDLAMPRFSGVFGSNALMLGYGVSLSESDTEGPGDNIKIGDMAPWFWLHDIDGISGSFRLEGASHTLYMGGNLEVAVEKVKAENIDPLQHFKFFWKYRAWKSGELDEEIKRGKWANVRAQDPKRALEAYSIPRLPGIQE
uniref:Uncharacterized protein n=1 Tax=Odontella aurita TaxID=265563 RepID=A0A7S4JIZ4_9STRA|mmetsp:Transcript_47216/g.142969  ORF Transcript_47216/g.142969 Transcript_47216/m.142969 type:complete len:206 (+) Transcript_47216:367-984(+)|eukprot:CAMPEP_0113533166 /NCGR_PEP_ID=MMETSP0015_2-20120614/4452_1 /TAXON_ID=2838 /ORGANISM="Odontella" /LENGTH=205 /DNA_ID=CAMNT_0000432185 /DNA_START=356 /DNA_END=973 /DNA_ORIENTATION=- /assembly_acc=CAM_ASM_000160